MKQIYSLMQKHPFIDPVEQSGILYLLKYRMGIHADYCSFGNFGSESRIYHTIIGRGEYYFTA